MWVFSAWPETAQARLFMLPFFSDCLDTTFSNNTPLNLNLKEQNSSPDLDNYKHILSLTLFAKYYTQCFANHKIHFSTLDTEI